MSNFYLSQSGGDSSGPTDTGSLSLVNTSNNYARINQAVAHNASVSPTTAPGTTPGDVTLSSSTFIYTDVIAMIFRMHLNAANSLPASTGVQVYIKLIAAAGSSHDLVIPMALSSNNNLADSIWTWTNPATTIAGVANTLVPNNHYDINGNAYTLEASAAVILPTLLAANFTSIVCTPDKYADVQITGTIEMAV